MKLNSGFAGQSRIWNGWTMLSASCRRRSKPAPSGTPGQPLQEYLGRYPQSRSDPLHLRWSTAKAQEAEARSALAQATALVGERAQQQMNAAKEQAIGAHRLPELRDASAAAGAALQRLNIAKAQIDDEELRIRNRQSELERRAGQLNADLERENKMLRDNADIVERLAKEESSLRAEEAGSAEREIATKAAFEQAAATLSLSETALTASTAERAEASAQRSQSERALREATERRDRLARQLADVERDLAAIETQIAALPDPPQNACWSTKRNKNLVKPRLQPWGRKRPLARLAPRKRPPVRPCRKQSPSLPVSRPKRVRWPRCSTPWRVIFSGCAGAGQR
jgi:hypothetical protein